MQELDRHIPTNTLAFDARRSSLRPFSSSVVVSLALVLSAPSLALAGTPTARSGAVIACFHKKNHRFTGVAHPDRCNLRGYNGTEVVDLLISGMKWGHWGANPTRAAFGVDEADGSRVRVIAYRPVSCGDGRTWYSRAVVVQHSNPFDLRLPTCRAQPSSTHALRASPVEVHSSVRR